MRKVRSRFALYPHPMYTVTYYKLGNAWFLDLPEYTGPSADLERVGSFHDFLELAARGQTTLVFHVDTKPFQDADVMQLTGSSGEKTGGYYHLASFQGQPIDLELWYNRVIYTGQEELPQFIYIRKIS